jgi:hypothetical protein
MKRVKRHKERPMHRTYSVQLLDAIMIGFIFNMQQTQIKPLSDHFSTAC